MKVETISQLALENQNLKLAIKKLIKDYIDATGLHPTISITADLITTQMGTRETGEFTVHIQNIIQ